MQIPTEQHDRINLGRLAGESNVPHDPTGAGQPQGSLPSPHPAPIGSAVDGSPEPRSLVGRRRARRQRWGGAVARVRTALFRYRRTLRAAASRSGRRRTTKRLQRLARRSRAIQSTLERLTPEVRDTLGPDAAHVLTTDVAPDATEIAVLGAAMRANRQVFIAVEQALDTQPPREVADELQRIKNQALQEAGTINAHIGELCVVAEEPALT